MKINFTQEHFQKMKNYLLDMLINNRVVITNLGQPLDVVELLHTTTINTLNKLKITLANRIRNLEEQDEWVAPSQSELNRLREDKEMINLIIGYKRYLAEEAEKEVKKIKLRTKIAQMKEEAKTPEDKLKEAEEELAALENN